MSFSTKHDIDDQSSNDHSDVVMAKNSHIQRISVAKGENVKRRKKIWIDLENSPHVPFFKPIIEELQRRGYSVVLTARDCFQVCELADLFQLQYRRVGHHYGKNKLAKVAGLGIRSLQLTPHVLREKPDLALSHGSRTMFLLASVLRIPTAIISDYEHARWVRWLAPSWVLAPEVISDDVLSRVFGLNKQHILKYPGIKEDVYAPTFTPDPSIKQQLGLNGQELVVTVRPPATAAHYHNPESEKLLNAVFEVLGKSPNTKVVLLPRTPTQETEVRKQWPDLFRTRKMFVPERVVDGLGLIWFSDLVISGGGTMNREAAALGVPVYSIFKGKIGAVDKYLAETGRLVMLESVDDVATKLLLARRAMTRQPEISRHSTLEVIIDYVTTIAESKKTNYITR